MTAELVHCTGLDHVKLPSTWRTPNPNQFQGSIAERLIEAAGRCCYDSAGLPTSRGSDLFHRNLAGLDGTTPHYSVHEHYHFTVETYLHPGVFLGIPDVCVHRTGNGYRVTLNLRHCLEWPNNVVFTTDAGGLGGLIARWGRMLRRVASVVAPQIVAPAKPEAIIEHLDPFLLVEPQRDTEAFVTLFLEDSRVWSHEMVRHRFNISQRSGRFVDETDRADCVHPLMSDYMMSVPLNGTEPDSEYVRAITARNHARIAARDAYDLCVLALQNHAVKKGLDKLTARKQARSAARYSLGNGLSTEMIFTCSIRSWRGIFKQRCNPAADQAIFELMTKAQEIVKSTKFGGWL